MTTPQILQLLYSFNTFSPEFSRCLDRLIQSDEEDHYLSNLQELELTRLVDFLDKVRVLPLASSSLRKDPAGTRDHPCHRRCFQTMFTQAAIHLQPQPDPTIFVHYSWRSHQSWRLSGRLDKSFRCVGRDARKHQSLYQIPENHNKGSPRHREGQQPALSHRFIPAEVHLSVHRHSTRKRSCGKG